MKTLCLLVGLFFGHHASAALKVVTTTPDLAWAIQKIGGPDVQVESLLKGTEDPHYVDAVPAFIFKVRKADLVCAVGLELESGWLPKIRQRAGARAKPYCEFGRGVDVLDKPQGEIDRSMGDVHASGNPHFHLSPPHLVQGAKQALVQLQKLLPEKSSTLKKRYDQFKNEMKQLEQEVSKLLKPVRRKRFLQYHQEFSYYFQTYGLINAGPLENRPGVPPSASRLAKLSLDFKEKDVVSVLAAKHTPNSTLERFQSLSEIPFLKLPLGMVQGEHESYFDLQKQLASEIVKHATK